MGGIGSGGSGGGVVGRNKQPGLMLIMPRMLQEAIFHY